MCLGNVTGNSATRRAKQVPFPKLVTALSIFSCFSLPQMDRCAVVAPTPRPMTSNQHQMTTSCYKPRINITEYTDRYIHPNKHDVNKFRSSSYGQQGKDQNIGRRSLSSLWPNEQWLALEESPKQMCSLISLISDVLFSHFPSWKHMQVRVLSSQDVVVASRTWTKLVRQWKSTTAE